MNKFKENENYVKVEEIKRGYGANVMGNLLGSSPPYPIEAKYEEVDRHLVVYQEELIGIRQRHRKILRVLHKGEEKKAKRFCKKTLKSLMSKCWPDEFG